MLSERNHGLQSLHLLLQLALAQLGFWTSFWLYGTLRNRSFFTEGACYDSFALTMGMAMIAFRGTLGFGRLNILRVGWIQNHSDTSRILLWIFVSFLILKGMSRGL